MWERRVRLRMVLKNRGKFPIRYYFVIQIYLLNPLILHLFCDISKFNIKCLSFENSVIC